MLAGFGAAVAEVAHHAAGDGVVARVVAQQPVDGTDVEHFGELAGGLGADDEIQAVAECGHRYSTPINNTSPRWPVW